MRKKAVTQLPEETAIVLNFNEFKKMLTNREILLPEFEIEEFFDEISERLVEETNIFTKLDENEVLEKLSFMLVFFSADSLLDLNLAKIVTLLLSDSSNFQKLCLDFSRDLVKTTDYYDDTECFAIILDDEVFEEQEILERDEITGINLEMFGIITFS